MKYAVVQVVNGNFSVVSEHGDNLDAARVRFHSVCGNLWNSQDVITAKVAIVSEDLSYVDGHVENISHAVEPQEQESEE